MCVATLACVEAEVQNARLCRAIVPVTDIARATAFYGALLQLPGTPVSAGEHYVGCGSTLLACDDARAAGDVGGDARPNPEFPSCAVDDLDAAFDRALHAGCRRLDVTIEMRRWGERSFCIVEPFGNPLYVGDAATIFTGSGCDN